MILSTTILLKWGAVVLNRIASWFGSGYYIKKGVKKKNWRYFVLAVVISVLMLVLLLHFLR